jgi:hypothetical protein
MAGQIDHTPFSDDNSSGFGRGWVPLGRDIGLPGEGGGVGAQGGGQNSPLPFRGGVGGGACASDSLVSVWVDIPRPNPSPKGEGLS